MEYEKFNYEKLEEAVKHLETEEDRLNYISLEMIRCRNMSIDIRKDLRKLEIEPINITTKNGYINKIINGALKEDIQFKNDINKEIINILEEKLCEPYDEYLTKADELKKHYQEAIELQIKAQHLRGDKRDLQRDAGKNENKIIWRSGKEKLLRTFKVLTDNELLPVYNNDEILIHFIDERRSRFNFAKMPAIPFSWLDSDSTFSVFVNELAKRKDIIGSNKFKTFAEHFVNKNGERFKNLAQKRNYTDNTNNTGDNIRKILNEVEIE